MHILRIGNPENRRVQLFCQAAERLHLPVPEVVSYLDILTGKIRLEDQLRPNTLMRIDSPGENFEVEKRLIAFGASAVCSTGEYIPAPAALTLEEDHGRIRYLRQWYLGYNTLLMDWQQILEKTPAVAALNTPAAIVLMFDKVACQQRLHAHGVLVPRRLQPVMHYELLRKQLKARALTRVFVKPSHSSSAAGVIAYRMGEHREEAITSVELVRKGGEVKLYNSLKVRKYTNPEDIALILNDILREGAIVEVWIPKASMGKYKFDVRIVVAVAMRATCFPG